MAQWKWTHLVSMRMQIWSLPSLSGLRIWCCRELWHRPAAAAQIQPLAWEPPYAKGAALKRQKKKKYIKWLNSGNKATISWVPYEGWEDISLCKCILFSFWECPLLCSFVFPFSFGCTQGMWKILGQGSNPSHSSNLSHSSDNVRS